MTLNTFSTASGPSPFEVSETNAEVGDASACDLLRPRVSDEELEQAGECGRRAGR